MSERDLSEMSSESEAEEWMSSILEQTRAQLVSRIEEFRRQGMMKESRNVQRMYDELAFGSCAVASATEPVAARHAADLTPLKRWASESQQSDHTTYLSAGAWPADAAAVRPTASVHSGGGDGIQQHRTHGGSGTRHHTHSGGDEMQQQQQQRRPSHQHARWHQSHQPTQWPSQQPRQQPYQRCHSITGQPLGMVTKGWCVKTDGDIKSLQLQLRSERDHTLQQRRFLKEMDGVILSQMERQSSRLSTLEAALEAEHRRAPTAAAAAAADSKQRIEQ